MAKQPLDPYLQPALMILADGQPRSAGQYHQQLFQRIQANVSLRHESWKAADHPQFQQLSMLVAAALVKAGLLDASDQGELAITPQGRKLLATHPRLITFNDLRRFRQHHAATAGSSTRSSSTSTTSLTGWWIGEGIVNLLDLSLQGIDSLAEGFDWS